MLAMTDSEIGEFLKQQETGVLASCSDGEAYGTPESFGYRNGIIYFLLDMPTNSKKKSFIEETDLVSFTVYEANSSTDFASVIIHGTLEQLPEAESKAEIALGDNEQFPSKHVFPIQNGESVKEYKLAAERISGRKGPGFEIDTAMPEIPVVNGE